MRSSIKQKRSRKGAILIATLGLILLMTILVVEFLKLSFSELKRLSLEADQDELRAYAYSSLEITLAVLAEIKTLDGGLFTPAQGWGTPLAYAAVEFPEDIKVQVRIEDLSGKVPLSLRTDPTILNTFFEKLGFSSSDANTLTDSLLDWVDEDDNARLNGAESSYYERKDPPYKPTNEPLTNYEELHYIQGFEELFFDENSVPNEAFAKLKDNTTLAGTGPINVNTASPIVLEVLEDVANIDRQSILDKREQYANGSINASEAMLKSNKDLNLAVQEGTSKEKPFYGFNSTLLKVNIRAYHGDNLFELNTLLEASASSASKDKKNNQKSSNKSTNNTSEDAQNKPNAKSSTFTILNLVENAPLD